MIMWHIYLIAVL